MQHLGFLVVSNTTFRDFRYPLVRQDQGYAIKTPGLNTVTVFLTRAKKEGAKLLLDSALDAETKAAVRKIWGK